MNTSDLVTRLIEKGFIRPEYRAVAESEISKYRLMKEDDSIEQTLLSRYKPILGNPCVVLRMILDGLPNKQSELHPEEMKSISDEIYEEERDFREHEYAMKNSPDRFRQEWTEPNDPRFDRSPSVFDGPYKDHEEYKENTYISIRREANAEGTSMHEICRRKNLIYEYLIF